jgi:GT2 family glycosyltransferase
MKRVEVSIVIVSYNVANYLKECIRSIKRETICNYEIIVIDNNSEGHTVELLRTQHPDVTLIRNDLNLGFAKANNQGFKIANGRYVFMLNPDTLILNGAVDKLIQFLDEHPEIGACGPKNLNPDLTLQHNCHHFPSLTLEIFKFLQLKRFFPKNRLFGREHMSYWDYGNIRAVDWITGCSLMIRKDVLDRIGGLDENYFLYSEECDFCYQMKQQGKKIFYFPQAEIIHYGGESSVTQNYERLHSRTITKHLYVSRYYFYRKNYGKIQEFVLRFLDILYFILSLLKNKIQIFKKDRKDRITCAKIVLNLALDIF